MAMVAISLLTAGRYRWIKLNLLCEEWFFVQNALGINFTKNVQQIDMHAGSILMYSVACEQCENDVILAWIWMASTLTYDGDSVLLCTCQTAKSNEIKIVENISSEQ